jgi:hypothetical protein
LFASVTADRQRSRVYEWEDRVIRPLDPSVIAFPQVQGIVNAIWSEMGLLYPPRVERLPSQTRCRIADATRLTIRVGPTVPSWCLLHEIAHAMSSTFDGDSDGHGPHFLSIYIKLLTHYLRLNNFCLATTAGESRLKVN